MPTITHAESNVPSSNENPNVYISSSFNNNVMTKFGTMNFAAGRVCWIRNDYWKCEMEELRRQQDNVGDVPVVVFFLDENWACDSDEKLMR